MIHIENSFFCTQNWSVSTETIQMIRAGGMDYACRALDCEYVTPIWIQVRANYICESLKKITEMWSDGNNMLPIPICWSYWEVINLFQFPFVSFSGDSEKLFVYSIIDSFINRALNYRMNG